MTRQLLRTWPITVASLVAGTAGGWLAAGLAPTTYTAEARIGLGGQTLSDQAVPGITLAQQELAATFARYVDDSIAAGRAGELLGGDLGTVTGIAASPIAETSIIRIEVLATDEEEAVEAADAVAASLVEQVNSDPLQPASDETLQAFQEVNVEYLRAEQDVDRAQSRLTDALAEFEAAKDAGAPEADQQALWATASTRSDELVSLQLTASGLELQRDALRGRYFEEYSEGRVELVPVVPARVAGDDLGARRQLGAVVGAVLGLAAAVALGSAASRRRDRRLAAAERPRATKATAPEQDAGAVPPRPRTDGTRRTGADTTYPAPAPSWAQGQRSPQPRVEPDLEIVPEPDPFPARHGSRRHSPASPTRRT